MSTKNRIIYVTDLFTIVQVLSFAKDKENVFNMHDPQYEPYQLIEFMGEYESDVLKVGDMIPLEFERCRHIKQIGKIHQTPRIRFDYEGLREQTQKHFDVFAHNFNPQLIVSLREKMKTYEKDEEVAYRCFYNSFKMYRLREYVIEMAEILMSLAKQSPVKHQFSKQLMDEFKYLRFDDVLEKSLEQILGTNFSMGRNDSQAWFEDSQKLFASYFLFMKACDYFLSFCERIVAGTRRIKNKLILVK